ncbi:MAG: hypothetical protein KHX55_07990 [Proteobacteria bacterium]|nr:hypothetical protein [Pseudomonadota bacterium]
MKRISLLIGTALLLCAGTATAAEDYTCATPPTCAELGYTDTAANCEGKMMLKCPFDLTKVNCMNNVKRQMQQYDYYYADGSSSSNLISGRVVIGIKKNWTSQTTSKILALQEKSVASQSAAAQYCAEYSTPGTTPGQWTLPACGAGGYSLSTLNEKLSHLANGTYTPEFSNGRQYFCSSKGCNLASNSSSSANCSSGAYARCILQVN